jgi:hypothetical protein
VDWRQSAQFIKEKPIGELNIQLVSSSSSNAAPWVTWSPAAK